MRVRGRAHLAADGVGDAAEVLDVAAVQLARAVAWLGVGLGVGVGVGVRG